MGQTTKTDNMKIVRRRKTRQRLEQFTLYCDWSRKLAPIPHQSDSKLKSTITRSSAFCRAWGNFVGFPSISHWLFKLFSFLLIGRNNYFGFSFTTQLKKPSQSYFSILFQRYFTLTADSEPSSLKSSNFITSAIMKPFSKSVWIFPAAWGALVPF